MDSEKVLMSFVGHQHPITFITFTSDGHSLAGADYGGNISVWNLRSKELRCKFGSHLTIVHSLAFLPKSSILFSGSDDGTMKFWDSSKGIELATLGILGGGSWVISTPEGYFDGTSEGRKQVYRTRRE